MKQTAMQDLRGDLMLTIDSSKEGLLEIENVAIRKACQEVVRLTLKKIIKRIDDELLEMEKQKTIDFACEVMFGRKDIGINLRNFVISKYNETFKQQAQ
jgi:hypothetical protein